MCRRRRRRRAADTAQLAGYSDFETLDDLMEWDYGTAEGRRREEAGAVLGYYKNCPVIVRWNA
ncbi:histidine phosphatase family protein [Bifidobacterium sp. ESL0732]|uniref:histidine phosphatase family protein n=1 Tax=Bifidobacterium sp. ESL0732 TaxID=2983222 RepID=UPI0023F8D338|nr:histidine phosphatase family protein [Bifidobacterium sp. ESL0732]WEV64974.1 histidine phosphatase family protein [Bifidobacterium sp. ESL0732]